jgi:hypothetical protein
VRKRLKKKDLTFDDFCKRVKRVKRVGKKLGGQEKSTGLKTRHYNGEDRVGRRSERSPYTVDESRHL